MSTNRLHDWFASELGQHVLAAEQLRLDAMVSDIFGFNAMQVGFEGVDLLRANRIPFRFTVGLEAAGEVRADARDLPILTQSLDLVLLPHLLEFHSAPHQVLREVERVLMPEGHVVITGFNPWSLWGLWRLLHHGARSMPWCGRFISLRRLKDWLALLGLEVTAGQVCCYAPPMGRAGWINRFKFLEAAGDRWWALAGAVYVLQAKKRVRGMRLITPRWNEKRVAEKALAPAAHKIGHVGRMGLKESA